MTVRPLTIFDNSIQLVSFLYTGALPWSSHHDVTSSLRL